MDRQILITGGNGQLGKALQNKYPTAHAVDIEELDITDQQQVESYDWSDIKVLINAAAYTDVDGAERPDNRELAHKVNAGAVLNLAKVAIEHEIILVHISSDYVFDGKKQGPYKEADPFCPVSIYGASKADGDKA
ncbi:MAG: NAD(P)-dependent oxidoreductase, partial [Prolixibacteraceae bacterium]|nr:NAD(P)-dependent oxidoreductase [Prolixibacteraceae bacterium]